MTLRLALLLALASSVACGAPEPPGVTRVEPAPWPRALGHEAPVSIQASVSDGLARVQVTPLTEVSDLHVDVYGLDGLEVRGSVEPRVWEQVIPVAAPGTESTLVVEVAGVFAGRRMARHRTVTVPGRSLPPAPAHLDARGRRIHVLPARR